MRHVRLVLLSALPGLIAFTAGCARKKHVVRVPVQNVPPVSSPASVPPANAEPGEVIETGLASWYGHPYHGRQAADGEIYDMEKMTAAHRTLSFNTWLRVENVTNGKTVDVRITDRGPFVGGRVIDLSHAAARQIEMVGPGTAQVRLRLLAAPAVPEPALFGVQVGAFQVKENAERMRMHMERRYGSARITERPGDIAFFRVLVGREPTTQSAVDLGRRIRSENPVPEAFVVRIDQSF